MAKKKKDDLLWALGEIAGTGPGNAGAAIEYLATDSPTSVLIKQGQAVAIVQALEKAYQNGLINGAMINDPIIRSSGVGR